MIAKASLETLLVDGDHAVDLHVPHAGIETEFVAALAAAGIGVAFLERRAAYPLIERRALLECGLRAGLGRIDLWIAGRAAMTDDDIGDQQIETCLVR